MQLNVLDLSNYPLFFSATSAKRKIIFVSSEFNVLPR